jgi:hypothetical protein
MPMLLVFGIGKQYPYYFKTLHMLVETRKFWFLVSFARIMADSFLVVILDYGFLFFVCLMHDRGVMEMKIFP